jgi:hypothetical protein
MMSLLKKIYYNTSYKKTIRYLILSHNSLHEVVPFYNTNIPEKYNSLGLIMIFDEVSSPQQTRGIQLE